ncbi:TatD family hydrolase [Bergeriella denitrificans]|uniref:Putative deoxyribonuclease n=1 Tax=Bergeriella denitrificans TaxID=494 RepID=A0A378UGT0_BERDE|nr:TatD family hydrolase [Bergeriella denitrificans]STZ76515.1 putative deoxyribonuclease [Bergeriella denitrificans]
MHFTDTHCHLAEAVLQADWPNVLAAAEAAGVTRFIVPATRPQDWQAVLDFPEKPSEKARIHRAAGIHPWFAAETEEGDWQRLEALLAAHPQLWVGEIGLDALKTERADGAQQQAVLIRQLVLAQQYRRRVIVHNVKAGAALAAAVKAAKFTQGGIIHAFSGSAEEARQLIGLGFYIGIGSLLLNPAAKKIRVTLKQLPLERIVLETDSPFMLKNAVNTPANIRAIAAEAAQILGIGIDTLARQTEANTDRLLAAFQTA